MKIYDAHDAIYGEMTVNHNAMGAYMLAQEVIRATLSLVQAP